MPRLIDADAAVAELDRMYPGLVDEADKLAVRFARNLLMGADPIDAEPVRHGCWAHLGGDEWCCTDCGFVINTEGSWEEPSQYKFCWNCGAKMDAKEDE